MHGRFKGSHTGRLLFDDRIALLLALSEQIRKPSVDVCKSPETSISSETSQHRAEMMGTTQYLTVGFYESA